MIALSPVSGYTQNPGLSIGPRSRAFSIIHGYHPQSSAYFDAMASAGGAPEIGKLIAHDLFIRQLANAGLLARLGYVYPWLGGTAATNRINAGSAGPAAGLGTFVGTVTHSAGGIQSDGATGYFGTGITPADSMSPTSGVIFSYTSGPETTTRFRIGASGVAASYANLTGIAYGGGGTRRQGGIAIATSSQDQAKLVGPDAGGMLLVSYSGSRIGSLYDNTGLIATSLVEATGSLQTQEFYILALNAGGSPAFVCTRTSALAGFGGGMTQSEASQFCAFVARYMSALGRAAA